MTEIKETKYKTKIKEKEDAKKRRRNFFRPKKCLKSFTVNIMSNIDYSLKV